MNPLILNGTEVALEIERELFTLIKQEKIKPGIAFILVGDNPASLLYVSKKKAKCKALGLTSVDHSFPINVCESTLIKSIQTLNADPHIDGILVQLPLPPHLNPHHILCAIDPKKDVDGFHPINMGRLLLGDESGFCPCTPLGIYTLMQRRGIDPSGSHVVIVGRSNIVGKPLAALLVQKKTGANATVTLAHSATKNLSVLCRSADILIAATGTPHMIGEEMVKEGAVVIDVGINRVDGAIVGDVDYKHVAPKCRAITPVPGGVGPMTIAMLLQNTFRSFQQRRSDEI